MDLYKIVPENNDWTITENIVYANYLAKIPVLVKDGEELWVYLDIKISKYVLKMVKILIKLDIPFLFKSTSIFFDHKFTDDEMHEKNLKQYIRNITNEKFYDGFQKIGFDFIDNISKYLVKYECYVIFNEVFTREKKRLLAKTWDYYTNKEYFNIPREEIRDYISSLEREVKINLLF